MNLYKKHYFIAALSFIAACNNTVENSKNVANASPKKNLQSEIDTIHIAGKIFSISLINKADYEKIPSCGLAICDNDTDCMNEQDHVKRRGLSLIFQLSNKNVAILENDTNIEHLSNYQVYKYIGNLPDIGQWLVSAEYYEDAEMLLIDQQNGDTIHITDQPCISPDKKYFIYGSDAENIEGVNALYLYEIINKKPKLVGERELKLWGPEGFKWVDNNTLLSQIVEHDTLIKYVKIDITNDTVHH